MLNLFKKKPPTNKYTERYLSKVNEVILNCIVAREKKDRSNYYKNLDNVDFITNWVLELIPGNIIGKFSKDPQILKELIKYNYLAYMYDAYHITRGDQDGHL